MALVAHAAIGIRSAAALARSDVAEVVERADWVALARSTPFRSEAESAGSALVALTADHVRFTVTLAT